jgi:hypothetical protein
MPQTTYLPVYKADYPLLCKVQKPGGVTVSAVLIATAVPNKPQYAAGTIQMTQLLAPEEAAVAPEEVMEEVQETNNGDEEDQPKSKSGKGKKSR